MKNFIKKYWTHTLNLLFFIHYICTFTIIMYKRCSDATYISLLGIGLIIVIAILIEIIYFMIKVAKNTEIKDKPLHIICIYFLNIFYIPCLALTYIYQDNKAKKKNIIYVIISVLLCILLTGSIFKFALMDTKYEKYISEDKVICINIPYEYNNDVIVGQFDMYFTKQNFNIGVFLYNDTEETAQDILDFQKSSLDKTRDDFKLIRTDNKHEDGKTINTYFCEGKYNDIQNYYYISTITFDKKEKYVVCLIGISSDDQENHKNEFEDILDKLELN